MKSVFYIGVAGAGETPLLKEIMRGVAEENASTPDQADQTELIVSFIAHPPGDEALSRRFSPVKLEPPR